MAQNKIQINEEQEALLRKLAFIIAEKGMTSPTIFFLESVQPLNYIGSQVMAYLEPFLTFVIPRDHYNNIQKILEQRKGIDYFLTLVEDEEYKRQQKNRAIKELLKKDQPVNKRSFLGKLKFWKR